MTEPVRLSKRLAELLPCSRREAELYIEGGWVSVDGKVVEEPQFKVDAQRVELLPGAVAAPIGFATLLLHKPAGYGIGSGAPANISLQEIIVHLIEEYAGHADLLRECIDGRVGQ